MFVLGFLGVFVYGGLFVVFLFWVCWVAEFVSVIVLLPTCFGLDVFCILCFTFWIRSLLGRYLGKVVYVVDLLFGDFLWLVLLWAVRNLGFWCMTFRFVVIVMGTVPVILAFGFGCCCYLECFVWGCWVFVV